MSDTRKRLVGEAFAKLDKTGDGKVTIDNLRGVYDVKVYFSHSLYFETVFTKSKLSIFRIIQNI